MPPATGQPRADPQAPADRSSTAANWPPPLLDPEALAELPIPLQVVVVAALLPYEVATTSMRILKNTEALLGELVFHMNALRPAVSGVGQAYAEGQFDHLFRTMGQIQQGTNAVALVWAPLTGLRDRLVPGQSAAPRPGPPPAAHWPAPPYPGAGGYAPHRAVPAQPVYPPPRPVTVAAVPPSTIEYVGRLGGALWDQATSLPGAGWLRRGPAPETHPEPPPYSAPPTYGAPPTYSAPPTYVSHRTEAIEPAGPEPADPTPSEAGQSLLGLAAPLVPGPVRRLFGG